MTVRASIEMVPALYTPPPKAFPTRPLAAGRVRLGLVASDGAVGEDWGPQVEEPSSQAGAPPVRAVVGNRYAPAAAVVAWGAAGEAEHAGRARALSTCRVGPEDVVVLGGGGVAGDVREEIQAHDVPSAKYAPPPMPSPTLPPRPALPPMALLLVTVQLFRAAELPLKTATPPPHACRHRAQRLRHHPGPGCP